MNCPVCKTTALDAATLAADLPAHRCLACQGYWIAGQRYLQWLQQSNQTPPKSPPPPSDQPITLPVTDSRPGKFCPDCGRFLTNAPVNVDIPFHLDRCGACGGIWLDANEWEILQERNLHIALHLIFAKSWQHDVLRAQQEKARLQILCEKLGPTDLAEIRRVKAWIDQHSKRSELYAFLTNKD